MFDDLRNNDEPELPDLGIAPVSNLFDGDTDDPGWLIQGVWPADAYGVLGAAYKVGKTWLVLDLAISVASGGAWCGAWPTPQRSVLLFLSEGGRRKMRRRMAAVAASKGLSPDDVAALPIRVSLVPPNITDPLVLAAIREEIEKHPAGLVVLDPWYLSAPGVRMADLVNVGAVLRDLQITCQLAGAALVISHHWNQTGTGNGAARFSGAGMAEWGRVLLSVEAASESRTLDGSRAVLRVDATGDEIAPHTITVVREITTDDPTSLVAPMTYRVAPSDLPADLPAKPNTETLVLAVLRRRRGEWLTWREIGDVCAEWGFPRQKRTLLEALGKLDGEHPVDVTPADKHQPARWCLQ